MKQDEADGRRRRKLMQAFVMLGTILGLGAFGLAKSILMFGQTAGWLRADAGVGPFYYWLLTGTMLGLALGWGLIRARGKP